MVLVISQNKKNANALADILYYMGILSLGVTPKEAASEISSNYSAVIVSNAHMLPDPCDFVDRLKRYASDTPFFSVSELPLDERVAKVFDLCFQDGIYSTTMVKEINKYCALNGKRAVGCYSLAGIDAGCDLPRPKFFENELKLTKTEAMILRYLIRIYPRRAGAKEILLHAFKSGAKPEPASVRTHISVMNKKFKAEYSRAVVSSSEEGGYTVLTPEYFEQKTKITI